MNEVKSYSLIEEIEAQLEGLNSMDICGEQRSKVIEDLATLYNLKIEEIKAQTEHDEKIKLGQDQLDEQVKDRYFRTALEAAGIVLPLIFYAVWMKRGFKFEETGTYTSTTFRGLFNRFKPTAK